MSSSRSSALSFALALALVTANAKTGAECLDPKAAAAPTPNPTEAKRLFADAKQMMKEGRLAEACPMLETSLALDPGGGTLLQLAYCLELQGKLASSHARYTEALAVAEREKNERRAELSREHLVALSPRLSKIELRINPETRGLPGFEVRRDGVCLAPSSWDEASPVDPGRHVLSATAAGKKPWQIEIDVTQEGASTVVEIPLLEAAIPVAPPAPSVDARPATAAPAPAPTAKPPARVDPRAKGSAVPGIVVLSGGALGLGIGAVTGIVSLSMASDLLPSCREGVCPPSQEELGRQVKTFATVSTVGFVAGGALTLAGVVLLVERPFERSKAPPRVAVGPGSVWLMGAF